MNRKVFRTNFVVLAQSASFSFFIFRFINHVNQGHASSNADTMVQNRFQLFRIDNQFTTFCGVPNYPKYFRNHKLVIKENFECIPIGGINKYILLTLSMVLQDAKLVHISSHWSMQDRMKNVLTYLLT